MFNETLRLTARSRVTAHSAADWIRRLVTSVVVHLSPPKREISCFVTEIRSAVIEEGGIQGKEEELPRQPIRKLVERSKGCQFSTLFARWFMSYVYPSPCVLAPSRVNAQRAGSGDER